MANLNEQMPIRARHATVRERSADPFPGHWRRSHSDRVAFAFRGQAQTQEGRGVEGCYLEGTTWGEALTSSDAWRALESGSTPCPRQHRRDFLLDAVDNA